MVVGSGGREHALTWKLFESPNVDKIYIAPGNGGTEGLGTNVDIDVTEIVNLADFAASVKVDLVVVGPELPLALGLVDEMLNYGVPAFGPMKNASMIESSKVFAKEFMSRNGIPTARFEIVNSMEELSHAIRKFDFPVVLKADGLAAGKGTFIVESRKDALAIGEKLLEQHVLGKAGDMIVVEEYLAGVEVSFQVITDGRTVIPLATSQDFKRAFDGDEGPNTGGMGAFSPVFFLSPDVYRTILNDIVRPTIQALDAEGRRYIGCLYTGIMLTKDGPYVLEYNCRFGDPETQVVLPRMNADFYELCEAAIKGELNRVKCEWYKDACVCVVLASKGYPGSYEKGFPITGINEALQNEGLMVFHAGTKLLEDGTLVTNGGRVLNVVALGDNLREARQKAYDAVDKIQFENKFFRNDIGKKAEDMLKKLAHESRE